MTGDQQARPAPSAHAVGPRSPRVAAAKRLAKRAHRARERRFLAEGPQAVREALGTEGVRELFVTREAADRHGDLVATARDRGLDVVLVGGDVLDVLAQTITPQGMVAVCDFVDRPLADTLAGSVSGDVRLAVVLAQVRDPGNAGTVIRTADAAGADIVVLSGESVDPYNGKCVRASAGSLFHLPIVTGASTGDTTSALHDAGVQVLAADGHGDVDLDTAIDDGLLARPTAWLFGNEAWGLPDDTRALADAVVRVPIHGHAESLNLATAAAVCLYASARALRVRS